MRFVTDLSKGILGQPDSPIIYQNMLDSIPDSVFLKDNVKILTPACGHTTEADVVVKKMKSLGRTDQEIQDSIYLVDKYKVFTKDAIRKGYKNVFKANFLEWSVDLKFDVIIGNPPYQGTNTVSDDRTQPKNHNLWTKFIHKSFEVIEDAGYVAFVTPDSWMSPTNDVFQLFKENQLHTVDVECGQHFTVGSSFTSWVSQKAPVTKDTKFNNTSVNLKNFPYLPRDLNNTLEIHKKVINSSYDALDIKGDTTCHSSKDVVSKTESKEFCYELLHTNAQTRYGKIKSKYFDNIKVMWTLSGYYKPKVDLGTSGFTEVNQAIIVANQKEADAVYSYMNSKLYYFIVTTAKWSGFLNGKVFKMLPDLGKSVVYTDEDLYKLFGLTQQEIEVVESYN